MGILVLYLSDEQDRIVTIGYIANEHNSPRFICRHSGIFTGLNLEYRPLQMKVFRFCVKFQGNNENNCVSGTMERCA